MICFDTEDGIKYMEIYLVEALFPQMMNRLVAFFFEVPVPESNTAFGFISGIFSKTSKSSSSTSKAGDSPEVLFFFFWRSYFDFRPFTFSLHFSAEKNVSTNNVYFVRHPLPLVFDRFRRALALNIMISLL